jgi:hypothetical protein
VIKGNLYFYLKRIQASTKLNPVKENVFVAENATLSKP